jgi:hypothetical protein
VHAGKCIALNSSVFAGHSRVAPPSDEGASMMGEQMEWIRGEVEDAKREGGFII